MNQQELAKRYGITIFEKPHPDAGVKSIGYSPTQRKWYGWSHRAIFGFGVGATVKAGDVIAQGTASCLRGPSFPVGFEARSLEDARAMAATFAGEVA